MTGHSVISRILTYGPPHDKTNKMTCAPSEDSDQLGHPPSLISLRCPLEETVGPYLPIKRTVKTDQTGWMPRLIRVFAGCTCYFVGFGMRQPIWFVIYIFVRVVVITPLGKLGATNSSFVLVAVLTSTVSVVSRFFQFFLLVREEGCDLWLWHSLKIFSLFSFFRPGSWREWLVQFISIQCCCNDVGLSLSLSCVDGTKQYDESQEVKTTIDFCLYSDKILSFFHSSELRKPRFSPF